jgi:hypothetical protein
MPRPVIPPLCSICGATDPALFYPRLKSACRKCHITEKKIYYKTRKVNFTEQTTKQSPITVENPLVKIEELTAKITELEMKLEEQYKYNEAVKLIISNNTDNIADVYNRISRHSKHIDILYENRPKPFTSAFV